MVTIEIICAVIGAAAVVIGGFFTAIRMATAPMHVVIQNNTNALDRVVSTLDKHEEKLTDHGERIACIEAVHEAVKEAGHD